MPSRLLPITALLAFFALPAFAQAGTERLQVDFQQLDPGELRAAEQALPQLVDRRTGQALREPANDAEAYVIARQQRLVKRLSTPPQTQAADEGGVTRHFWPAARATRVSVGADGQPSLQCVAAASLLKPELPDFRLSNRDQRPAQ